MISKITNSAIRRASGKEWSMCVDETTKEVEQTEEVAETSEKVTETGED
jgi:hypothetical protein